MPGWSKLTGPTWYFPFDPSVVLMFTLGVGCVGLRNASICTSAPLAGVPSNSFVAVTVKKTSVSRRIGVDDHDTWYLQSSSSDSLLHRVGPKSPPPLCRPAQSFMGGSVAPASAPASSGADDPASPAAPPSGNCITHMPSSVLV